ncbi:MAG: hypothetical protein JO257_20320 [Deltaproteobacteria bacterium]|nr:hypothetical protein [Deltaproteobacteria bacterium]
MRSLIVAGVLVVSGVAHADRTTVIDVGMTFGALDKGFDATREEKPLVGPRVTLGFEGPLVAMPDHPGYNFAGALVPELVLGSYVYDDHAEGYIGVGLRADLQMGQREQGLLRVSARGALYLVGRALVIGDTRDPMYEVGFGEYLTRFRTRERVGFELTFVDRPSDHGSVDGSAGGFLGLYIGR